MTKLVDHSYGKPLIRLFKVTRRGDRHDLSDLTVAVRFEGDFDEAYVEGDNERVLPAEAIRNTVHALAVGRVLDSIEIFGLALAEHFLVHHPQLSRVRVELAERRWERLGVGGRPQGHAFQQGGPERRTAVITSNGEQTAVVAGVDSLPVLKTAGARFEGFLSDQYTGAEPEDDRILAASLTARWTYTQPDVTFGAYWQGVRQLLLESFVQHASQSMQHTIYAMADVVLASFDEIAEITLELPTQEYRPVDLSRFGVRNDNEVYLASVEPDSLVKATVTRDNRPNT
jgi:urate oxidase